MAVCRSLKKVYFLDQRPLATARIDGGRDFSERCIISLSRLTEFLAETGGRAARRKAPTVSTRWMYVTLANVPAPSFVLALSSNLYSVNHKALGLFQSRFIPSVRAGSIGRALLLAMVWELDIAAARGWVPKSLEASRSRSLSSEFDCMVHVCARRGTRSG